MADNIYQLLGMEPTGEFMPVLRRYAEAINPNNYAVLPDTLLRHFCLVNTPGKLGIYFNHVQKGTLNQYLEEYPVPYSLARAEGVMGYISAMTRLISLQLYGAESAAMPGEAPVVHSQSAMAESPPRPSTALHRDRFMPSGRRPPSRRERHEEIHDAPGLT